MLLNCILSCTGDHLSGTENQSTYSKYFAEAKQALNRLGCANSQGKLQQDDDDSVNVFVDAYSKAYAHLDRLYMLLREFPDHVYYSGIFCS
jgi:hypothetical protein